MAALQGSSSTYGDISGALNAQSSMAGTGNVSADGTLLSFLASLVSGASAVSAAITGAFVAQCSLSGTALVTSDVDAVAHLQLVANGIGSLLGATQATGDMSSTISSLTPLSPETLASAVWGAVAAEYVTSGTMGLLMNQAGAGASPPAVIAQAVWDALRGASVSPNSMGEALVELFLLMGLDPAKPLVTTTTSRNVPADGTSISQSITQLGNTITVVRT
jgi:hypothetical protein